MSARDKSVLDALDKPVPEPCPVQPLGHRQGTCFVISGSGEYRQIGVEKLESGKGVEALFLGSADSVAVSWPLVKFGSESGVNWRAAGRWLMQACFEAGLIDPASTEIRGVGVWRDVDESAVAHVGDVLIGADRVPRPLRQASGGVIWAAAPAIGRPADRPADMDDVRSLIASIQSSWGFKGQRDADLVLGWIGCAILGGFPGIRPTLVVTGPRGSGKSELTELVASLLGPMAGPILNDATEAGLRQGVNLQARAILLDEAEAGVDGVKLSGVMALLRRRYGGDGGRATRGGADHTVVNFTSVGAGFLAAVIPPRMTAADASRTVAIELGPLPLVGDATSAARRLSELRAEAHAIGSEIWSRSLVGSPRWDGTEMQIRAAARTTGADHREAATAAAILTGRDVLMNDNPLTAERIADVHELLDHLLVRDAVENANEGERCLAHLLGSIVQVAHGFSRSIAEIIALIVRDGHGADRDYVAALGRTGMRVIDGGDGLWIVSGEHPQLTRALAGTRWTEGGHKAALASLHGVAPAPNPVRIGVRKARALRLPAELLPAIEEFSP